MPYRVDDARWPLVTAHAIAYDPQTLAACYGKLEELLARNRTFVVLFDMRGATSSSERRRRLLEFGERYSTEARRYLAAVALVASSPIERGFITAGLWLQSPAFPMRVFSTAKEAEAWLLADFSHVLDPPGRLRAAPP